MTNATKVFEKSTLTNGDRIRNMTNDDLAWALMEFRIDAHAAAIGDECGLPSTKRAIREWLDAPCGL